MRDPVAVSEASDKSYEEGDEFAEFKSIDIDEVPNEPEVAKTELSTSVYEMLYKRDY